MRHKISYLAWLLLGALISQQVWAASSVSTRVKVVEEKIRLHDKKLRDLAAQQELTNKQVEVLRQAREKEMAVKLKQQAKQATVARAVAAAKMRQQAAEKSASEELAMQSTPPANYAYP